MGSVELHRTQNAFDGFLCRLFENMHFDPVAKLRKSLLFNIGFQKGDPFLAGVQDPLQIESI